MSSIANLSLFSPPILAFTSSNDVSTEDIAWVKAVQELTEYPSLDSLEQLVKLSQENVKSIACAPLKEKISEWLTPGTKTTLDDISRLAKRLLPAPAKPEASLPAPRTPNSHPQFMRVNSSIRPATGTISEHPSREHSQQASPVSAPLPADQKASISPLTLPK